MGLFKAIIYGALDSFEKLIGPEMLKKIKDKITSTIEMFLEKTLQLDEAYIKNELKAERAAIRSSCLFFLVFTDGSCRLLLATAAIFDEFLALFSSQESQTLITP